MGIIGRILSPFLGNSKPPRNSSSAVRPIQARFDAAQTTGENAAHWIMADALTADAGQRAGIRRTLRNRARYESANNSYLRGIVLTIANDTVGTGPTVKLDTGDQDADSEIEAAYHAWQDATNFAEKMRTVVQSTVVDGEVFGLKITNPQLPLDGVQLDCRLIEADQIASPTPWMLKEVDGIEFDSAGNPSRYHLLKRHPGSLVNFPSYEWDPIPADMMLHVFRPDRPTQHRGIPEVTPALPLFAMLRRYTLATLGAAETAADFAAVLYTDSPANEIDEIEPFKAMNVNPRQMMALPNGWKFGQMSAEQPTTTYPGFKTEILNEIARCLNLPFNVAACNSSSYNYSSGRLDHQIYFKGIRVRRDVLRLRFLNPMFVAWAEEAFRVGLIRSSVGHPSRWKWDWVWDENEHVDPQSEAKAQSMSLAAGTTTLSIEYAKVGKDWEWALEQRAREIAKCKSLGIPYPGAVAAPNAEDPQAGPPDAPQSDSRRNPVRKADNGASKPARKVRRKKVRTGSPIPSSPN
jgi:lambda family phage portal protein